MADISRAQARRVTDEITEAIRPILARHGLDPDAMRVRTRYGFLYSFNVEAPLAGEPGQPNTNTREAAAYAIEAQYRTELDPDAVGKTYRMQGVDYVFLGMNPRARKMPWLFRTKDGKDYRFPEATRVVLLKDSAYVRSA